MSANSEINSVSSLEFCQRIMSRLVSDIYYNKQNNSDFLLNKVKSIRSLNDPGNKRLKYILSELISNSDNMLKNFKTIKPPNSLNSMQPPYKKTSKFSTFSTVGNNSSAFEVQNIKVSTPTVHKNKEYLIQALGINKSKKGVLGKSNWVDAESSEDEEESNKELSLNEKEGDDLTMVDEKEGNDLTMVDEKEGDDLTMVDEKESNDLTMVDEKEGDDLTMVDEKESNKELDANKEGKK